METNQLIDQQHDLQRKLWADQYYQQGVPVIRLLGDLAISIHRQLNKNGEPDENQHDRSNLLTNTHSA